MATGFPELESSIETGSSGNTSQKPIRTSKSSLGPTAAETFSAASASKAGMDGGEKQSSLTRAEVLK